MAEPRLEEEEIITQNESVKEGAHGGDSYEGANELPAGWERAETVDQHIPYYVSHLDGQTQWNHPDMMRLCEKLEGLNEVKYAAYRTAMKLRAIQKATSLSKITMAVVEEAMQQHGLLAVQNSSTIPVVEMETVLVAMFNQAKLNWSTSVHPDYCTELALNWILNCFDCGRTGSMKVFHFKLALAILCSGALEEKYCYMFEQSCYREQHLTRDVIVNLIEDIMLVPLQLGEASSFLPGDADVAATDCLQFGTPVGRLRRQSIGKDDFTDWMMKEPKFIVWLPTLHRLALSETVKHEAKCGVCKKVPIVGLRFRSMKDFSTDFCQACYLTQKTTKDHKIKHPVREYCLATTTGDDVRDVAKVIRNKFTRRYRHKSRKYGFINYKSEDGQDEIDAGPVVVMKTVHDRIQLMAERLATGEDEEDMDDNMEDRQRANMEALEEQNRQLLEKVAQLRMTTVTSPPPVGSQDEELVARVGVLQDYTSRLEHELTLLSNGQQLQEQPATPLIIGGVAAVCDLSRMGSEEDEIEALVRLMVEACPKDQDPGEPYMEVDLLHQKTKAVGDSAAELINTIAASYKTY